MKGIFNFSNRTIGARLFWLLVVQLLVLAGLAYVAWLLLESASNTEALLNKSVGQEAQLVRLTDGFTNDVLEQTHALNSGTISWPEALTSIRRGRTEFEFNWKSFQNHLSPEDLELVDDVVTLFKDDIDEFFTSLIGIVEKQNRSQLQLFVSNDMFPLTGPFLDAVFALTSLAQIESKQAVAATQLQNQKLVRWTWLALVAGFVLSLALGFAVYRSITAPVRKVAQTVDAVAEGNFSARTELTGRDEISALGGALDNMLDDRVATLARVQDENDRLNASVVNLLQAVYQLSQRDLTVKVPVTEDVTGPVADSLNLLTSETANVLLGVKAISKDVANSSAKVKRQSDTVIATASKEQQEIERTATQLATATDSMIRIAKLAHACNEAAERATKSTETAQETVQGTVNGINNIRDTIRETEKRIKRLGERSQEISGVVNLINTIAERTHILALNASMHAASAGEAGRGFAVVADEVQRLAENAREATSEISSLVSNIQVETADTVTTMNDAISQVVHGTELAERAGSRMQETQKSTAELVAIVRQIAKRSREQAVSSNDLKERAKEIQRSSKDTNEKLREQTVHTERLVEYSQKLVEAVGVFRLPDEDPQHARTVMSPPRSTSIDDVDSERTKSGDTADFDGQHAASAIG